LNSSEKALFGVFDGHGGREVAVYCHNEYEKILDNSKDDINKVGEEEWLRKSFLKVDDQLRTPLG
jgi:serine/threonine protein phosphatase PrpC